MSKRVMVVDDSRIVQLQLKKILADTEYQIVAFCQSGEEALEKYSEVQPDLVTMDILMPGIDGLETARQLLKSYPNARILMVSSLAYDDTINEANDVEMCIRDRISPMALIVSVRMVVVRLPWRWR